MGMFENQCENLFLRALESSNGRTFVLLSEVCRIGAELNWSWKREEPEPWLGTEGCPYTHPSFSPASITPLCWVILGSIRDASVSLTLNNSLIPPYFPLLPVSLLPLTTEYFPYLSYSLFYLKESVLYFVNNVCSVLKLLLRSSYLLKWLPWQ